MSSKGMNHCSKDLISGLPDCLIFHILSYIPTKEAASTSLLGKRWRYLFALTPNLDFDDSIFLHPQVANQRTITKKDSKMSRRFVDFVDRALALHQNVPLNRFSLKCKDIVHPAVVIGWLLKVLHRGVSHLDLNISMNLTCPFPLEMFVSKTLVSLKIRSVDILTIDVNNVFLPKVKTLCLDYIIIENSVLAMLLSGCPALEELVLNNMAWDCNVSNGTVKRLTFLCSIWLHTNPKSVSFDTPNLVYLEYSDPIAVEYPMVNLDSLVEASLDLRMTSGQIGKVKFSDDEGSAPEEMVGNATDFLMGICNVKILYLSSNTLEVLTYCCKPIPKFNNLIHLTIKTNPDVAWESLPALFKNCPKLETLVFDELHHKFSNCAEEDGCLCKHWEITRTCLSSSPAKILKVLKFGRVFGADSIWNQIELVKHFLETMPNLEQLILYYNTSFDEDLIQVSKQLQKLPRGVSPKCEVHIISDNVSLSSIVPSTPSTKWRPILL